MLQKFLRNQRAKRDRGDSTLVSTVIIIPLIVAILITIIDTAIYFNNRAAIASNVSSAARTVAIFGGDGTATAGTPLEIAYGSPTDPCSGAWTSNPMIEVTNIAMNKSDIECQLMDNITSTAGIVNVKILDAQCGPNRSTFIGQQAFCEIAWRYDGVPASALTFMRSGNNAFMADGEGFESAQVTRVVTTTEVNLSDIPCRNRITGTNAVC